MTKKQAISILRSYIYYYRRMYGRSCRDDSGVSQEGILKEWNMKLKKKNLWNRVNRLEEQHLSTSREQRKLLPSIGNNCQELKKCYLQVKSWDYKGFIKITTEYIGKEWDFYLKDFYSTSANLVMWEK